ncbi:MAG: putative lipid II flippase FtsW [Pseudohongiellaceae bacterium]
MNTTSQQTPFEKPSMLLVLLALLLSFGLVMMASASVEIADSRYGDPFFFLKRQAVFIALGLLTLLITLHIPLHWWYKRSSLLLLFAFALLVLVLVPGIGHKVNGSTRWINLGLFNLQPSELAKVFIIMYLAAFLERYTDEVKQHWGSFIKPLLVLGAAIVLLQLEPDHGAIVILLATGFCMLFLAGAKLHRFFIMLLPCAAAATYLAISKPYVLARFDSFLDPWAAEYVYGDGYQLTQALIAFGRGEWFGVGLGNSIQKLYFLPEAHNDFVLAIIGEELGLVGVALVVSLFCLLVFKALMIGKAAVQQGNLFAGYLAYGLGLLFAAQAFINIGVNTGLLPTKGLTLPLVSYGGASLIVSCFMVALLVRVEYETRCLMAESKTRRGKAV